MNYGRGLNSIRIRFTLIFLVQLVVLAIIHVAIDKYAGPYVGSYGESAILLAFLLPMAGLTYFITGNLTRPIEELKKSTEAIARGDYESEVDVDCQCEVGGLASAFRTMVDRLNDNVRKINKLAFEDAVTGLPNRAILASILEDHKTLETSVLFIDLDRFKMINDTLGHQAGDRVLNEAAQRIQAQIPPEQMGDVRELISASGEVQQDSLSGFYLFRFAGDEFVMLVGGDVSQEQLAELSHKIISSLEVPFEYMQNLVRISATVGISIFGEHSRDVEELVKFADMAMYAAKGAGKSQFAFFDEDIRHESEDRLRLESELGTAFEERQFVMHYQPKIDAATGRCVGVEALVRWQHPRLGLILPGHFMDVIESANLMGQLGHEVVRLVAEQAQSWKDHGIDMPISINVCPSQFHNPEFASRLLDFMRSHDLDPSLIELELTETVAMAAPDLARKQLVEFTAAGIKVSIDDFGTGFSNLAQLYRLPFDVLKLDRSLIRDIVTDERSRTIVAITILMAHALDHQVIAEGVETRAQADVLRQLDCDQFQGFYFAYPMSAEDLTQWADLRKAA